MMIQELSAGDFVDMSIRKRFSSSCEGDRGTLESMSDRTKIKRRWWSCSQQTWLSAFSVFTGIALTALAGVMQTDPYRNWYKGISKLELNYELDFLVYWKKVYNFSTTAPNGSFLTPYFGEPCNVSLFDCVMTTKVFIYVPK